MSTYELDDEVVRQFLTGPGGEAALVRALDKQLPVLLPTKLGAIVRTADGAMFIRTHRRGWCWTEVTDGGIPTVSSPRYFDDHGLPKITRVLSEGVDL